MGLEPMISRTTIWRANQLHHTHHITYRTVFCPTKYHRIKFCGSNEPGGIRTLDLRLRRPLLYPAELQTHSSLNENLSFSNEKRVMGIEPTYPAWKAGVLPLNYTRRCPVPESNQRHKDFQSFALPTELTGLVAHNKDYCKGRNLCCQAKNENYK